MRHLSLLLLLLVLSWKIELSTSQLGGLLVNLPSVGTPYDYDTSSLSGTEDCALINIVMDESGTMQGEQNFMYNRAIPAIVERLRTKFGHVFICSHGFGSTIAPTLFHGCNDGATWSSPNPSAKDLSIMTSWFNLGDLEDSYLGILSAIDGVPLTINGTNIKSACGSLALNMMLVTDEDRDEVDPGAIVESDVQKALSDSGYTLNVLANLDISKPEEWKALGLHGDLTSFAAYVADGNGGFVVEGPISDNPNNYIESGNAAANSHIDYPPLVLGTDGALWDLGILRHEDQMTVDSFVAAFVDIKIREIELYSETKAKTVPPTTVNFGETDVAGDDADTSSGGGATGDPHFKTWKNEHFEYHGQCDMVLLKNDEFANGSGMEIHIRTKLVRFWSYIQTLSVRIGTDILEIQGTSDLLEGMNYWINYEFQGELQDLGGFPVSKKIGLTRQHKNRFEIDLGSIHPDQKIIIYTFKEFVGITFENASYDTFGKSVGMLGNFSTGATVARDGFTVINSFAELGNEWQVLPAEPKLFRESSHPQFPVKCIEPEDPRGNRHRRLDEESISEEMAEAACAELQDAADRKDCIYDILATQDVDMVGAY